MRFIKTLLMPLFEDKSSKRPILFFFYKTLIFWPIVLFLSFIFGLAVIFLFYIVIEVFHFLFLESGSF